MCGAGQVVARHPDDALHLKPPPPRGTPRGGRMREGGVLQKILENRCGTFWDPVD
jgi:hypothetical protein